MPNQLTVFRSAEGEAEYCAAYNSTLQNWPVPFEELWLPTRFGEAHLIACGPISGPPVLLLHAMGFSALEWASAVPYLSPFYRLYAPDILNDLGKTSMTRMVQNESDFCVWLIELFDGLKLPCPALVGNSFGGWLALEMALRHPQRVSKLAVIGPTATFYPYPLVFWSKAIALGLKPTRERAAGMLEWMTAEGHTVTEEALDFFLMGMRSYRPPKILLADVFTDDELRHIQPPLLLLIGEQERMYPPQKAIDRAARLIPNLRAEILPGVGHRAVTENPAAVSRWVLEFLEEAAPDAS